MTGRTLTLKITKADIERADSETRQYTDGSRCLLAIAGKRRFGPTFYASHDSACVRDEQGQRRRYYLNRRDEDRLWFAMQELSGYRTLGLGKESGDRIFASPWTVTLYATAEEAKFGRPTHVALAPDGKSLLGSKQDRTAVPEDCREDEGNGSPADLA